jgi:hypothetical protein
MSLTYEDFKQSVLTEALNTDTATDKLKQAGIKAKCKKQSINGKDVISIDTPTCEAEFTDEEQTKIVNITKGFNLTATRGLISDNGTYSKGGNFGFNNNPTDLTFLGFSFGQNKPGQTFHYTL